MNQKQLFWGKYINIYNIRTTVRIIVESILINMGLLFVVLLIVFSGIFSLPQDYIWFVIRTLFAALFIGWLAFRLHSKRRELHSNESKVT